jgi:hypothetical protein
MFLEETLLHLVMVELGVTQKTSTVNGLSAIQTREIHLFTFILWIFPSKAIKTVNLMPLSFEWVSSIKEYVLSFIHNSLLVPEDHQ